MLVRLSARAARRGAFGRALSRVPTPYTTLLDRGNDMGLADGKQRIGLACRSLGIARYDCTAQRAQTARRFPSRLPVQLFQRLRRQHWVLPKGEASDPLKILIDERRPSALGNSPADCIGGARVHQRIGTRIDALLVALLKPQQHDMLRRRHSGRGKPGDRREHGFPQLEDIVRSPNIDFDNPDPTPGHDTHETLSRHMSERLAHRRMRDTEPFGDFALADPGARFIAPLDNIADQRVGDLNILGLAIGSCFRFENLQSPSCPVYR